MPSGPPLVANMVESQVMKHHGVPIVIFELARNVPRHVVVHFSEILLYLARSVVVTLRESSVPKRRSWLSHLSDQRCPGTASATCRHRT